MFTQWSKKKKNTLLQWTWMATVIKNRDQSFTFVNKSGQNKGKGERDECYVPMTISATFIYFFVVDFHQVSCYILKLLSSFCFIFSVSEYTLLAHPQSKYGTCHIYAQNKQSSKTLSGVSKHNNPAALWLILQKLA